MIRFIVGLLVLLGLSSIVRADVKAPPSMELPPYIVLIVCKVEFVGEPTENDMFTNHRETRWLIKHGKMECRRHEVQLFDPVEGMPSNPQDPNSAPAPGQTFNGMTCGRQGLMMGAQYDISHANDPWRTWRSACPVPQVDTTTGRVTAWIMPPCGHADIVVCENDTPI